MTVELLAKQMMAGRVRPEKMLEKIKEGGISKSGKERINSDKDGKLDRESTYNHIQTLFDLSMISDEEYDVLLNLSLIPCSGILAIYFLELCEAESFDVINELILEGWINHDRIFDRISLHPLIADTVISASNYNVTKVEKFIRNCHQYMEKNDDSIEHISKEVLITYLPHISKMLLRGNSINNNVCDFIVSGAIGYFEYGYLNEAIKNCLKLISLINSNSDISTYNKIDAYGKLSSLYNINGDFNNAFECNEEAIKICINEYGEKHELTANNYRLIGETCAELKDYKKAEKYYLKALSILKKCPGDTSSYEVLVYNSIGVLYHLMGKYKEAVKYYLLAIENESNFEKDPHNLIITYVNLGEVYDELDMHEKAREYLSNAYNLSVRYYGEYHRLTSYACNQLGNHYNMQADYTYPDYVSAKEYFLKALEIRKKLFGEIHETTATSYSNLGGLFVMMGEYDEAEWYYNKALSIKRAIFGESEQLYAQYYGLALSLNKAELYDKALPYAIAALSLIDKIYDYPHKYTYHTLFVLGDIFAGLEKLDESIQYYKRAYDICLTLDEETDYFISGALYNVAEAFLNINALELAYLSIQESIKILNKSIDKNTYAFTIAFDLLGDILCENNDYIKAKEAYNRSLEQKLAFYGVNDEAVANAYYQLAFLSNKYEEYDEAVIYMEKCLQIRVELFGNNELVAKTYKNLAFIYAFKEDYDTAISKLEIAASIYSLCGDNYLYEKSEILECLGSFHIKCNHISTGVEYYKNTIDILEKLNIKEEKYDKLKKAIISLSKQE